MVSIDENTLTISMTRGDTFNATVAIYTSNGTPYTPEEGDVVRFAAKTDYSDSEPVILKVIPNDTLQLHLDPADTKELEFGKYVYDIELTYANGDVDTFIAKKSLVLTEEVH